MLEVYAPLLIVSALISFCIIRFFSNNFWNLYVLFALCFGVCALLLGVLDSHFLTFSLLLYVFFVILFILAMIDVEFLALPNVGLLIFLFVSIATIFYKPQAFVYMQIIQGFAIIGVLFVLKIFSESFYKKEFFGEADIIVLGGIGMVFGIKYCVLSIFIASFFALFVALVLRVIKHILLSKIPFVSFLFLGVCVLFFGGFEFLDNFISIAGEVNV